MEFLKKLNLERFFTPELLLKLLTVTLFALLVAAGTRILAKVVRSLLKGKATDQAQMLISKVIVYTGGIIIILVVLSELGVKLNAILGAAGVIGIAVGLASQTSLANIISGIFLISEKPFEVGDLIRYGSITGIVMSIDLLSIKIRTHDNLFVRIPSEKILNSELVNITRFPIRRMDINLSVSYNSDLQRVRRILNEITQANILCLNEPEPLYLYKEFGQSGIEILFAVWFEKANFVPVKNSLFEEIKRRFDEEGIEIPFPHRTLYSGKSTEPFPIRIVNSIEEEYRELPKE